MHSKNVEGMVKDSLCLGCGTCAGICPAHAINMYIDPSEDIYLPSIDNTKCDHCGICFTVCPGHSVLFKTFDSQIFCIRNIWQTFK